MTGIRQVGIKTQKRETKGDPSGRESKIHISPHRDRRAGASRRICNINNDDNTVIVFADRQSGMLRILLLPRSDGRYVDNSVLRTEYLCMQDGLSVGKLTFLPEKELVTTSYGMRLKRGLYPPTFHSN